MGVCKTHSINGNKSLGGTLKFSRDLERNTYKRSDF